MRFTFALIGAVALTGVTTAASARDYISIAGSSTVLPFATIVAEQIMFVETGVMIDDKRPKADKTSGLSDEG